jgi:cysteine-rich repeat protein
VGLSVVSIALALTGLAGSAGAAVPQLVQLEGVLTASAGSPAADGDYDIAFKLFDAEADGNQLWTEAVAKVTVKSGGFQHLLGTQTGLDPALFAGAAEVWLSVQVGADPPLARKRMASAPLALRSAMAEGLDCSGCVKLAQLDPQILAAFAKKADLSKIATSGAYADLSGAPDLSVYAKTAGLAAVALSGSYADLEGLPAFAKVATSGKYADVAGGPAVGTACGTGLVMKGIKADGSYDCVSAAFTAADLPKDGLDEVSNGLLFNQFNEVATNTTVIELPDNNPVGISSMIDVPDFGVAQALSITAEVVNSDTANLKITAIDPAGTKFVLWDKTAKGTQVKTTWPTLTKTVSGDLTTWIGKNPKGKWYLEVVDLAFLNNTKDGSLKGWSVNVQVLASTKVGVGGGLVLKNSAAEPYACKASVAGSLFFDSVNKTVRYCDGTDWRTLADTCGNGILESNEQCDDGNNTNGDGCSATCMTVCGDGKKVGKEECDDGNNVDTDACTNACVVGNYGKAQTNPGTSCLDILTKFKAASLTLTTGDYWIKAPKGQVIQVWCDMVTETGGYTYFPVASGGKTTSAFTDDNTCKDYGLDIFIPRSKAQWTVVLAKYDSSFFAAIPGVYKVATSNGANYTGCIMRHPASYGSGCADWRVADAGRWWLRDATYSEPNGDYTGNCWLSMYKWDVNDIQFNDGGCGNPTSKYICSTNDKL